MTSFTGHVQPAWPDYVTPVGWQPARAAGVSTVIDLRNPGEADREDEAPAVNGDVLAGIRFVTCPTEDPP
jgi:protein-tyrosine phosphatase